MEQRPLSEKSSRLGVKAFSSAEGAGFLLGQPVSKAQVCRVKGGCLGAPLPFTGAEGEVLDTEAQRKADLELEVLVPCGGIP